MKVEFNGILAAWLLHILAQLALILRAILRPHRDPASRIAWVVVIAIMPLLGILAYLFFGEVNIGKWRVARQREVLSQLPSVNIGADDAMGLIPPAYAHLFRVGVSISGLNPVGGNRALLLSDSEETVAAMIADIDAAAVHVHVLFYIWLTDGSGLRMVDALVRAAGRGVVCRVLVDDLGSRAFIRSRYWGAMREAGVRVAVALPIGNPLLRLFSGRIDVRNHRKLLIIDGIVSYCGSKNCADAEFRVKPRFAPWVDAMVRLEGPVARQSQQLFVADWMSTVEEDISGLLASPVAAMAQPGIVAQVIGTGPTVRYSAMPEMFESLLYLARHEVVVTTPYYVPNEPMQAALCAAAWRGVRVTLVLPSRNDSWVVSAASRSYYSDLLAAGVAIREYRGGLLHTKSVTVDGIVALIGSANLDRRSFDLNYESNILVCDASLAVELRRLQENYMNRADPISSEMVAAWPVWRRAWNNTIAMLGPLL